MGAKYQALKGMEDLFPGEIEKWQWLEEKTRNFFEGHGFREIRTPLLEYTELFTRSVGEASDIVHKEMFSFKDRGDRDISLRPEMTASVARAVIEKGLLTQAKSLRFYYIGPMFRAERPQAGRKRQFHQIGVEFINEPGQAADLLAISQLCLFVKSLGVTGAALRINDLGDLESQKKMAANLREYFSGQRTRLCEDCRYRLERNVLRIFDCKNPACASVIEKAPQNKPGEIFNGLIVMLEDLQVPLRIDPRLVRGLDYYNGVVFELAAEGLGAQDALAGGGRYDRLYEDLGSKPTPCTGFSIGMERLLAVLERATPPLKERIREKFIYFAPLYADKDAFYQKTVKKELGEIVLHLRDRGVRAWLGPAGLGIAEHLRMANKYGGKFVVIVGQDEWEKPYWTVKYMDEKEQRQIRKGQLLSHLLGEEPI